MREGSLQGRRYVVLAVMASMAMISVEATIVSTAMPGIAAQFGDLTLYSWVFSSFLLAQTAMTVVFGKLADMFGRKPIMLLGISIFLIGSFFAGFAWSMPTMIAFRFIQGVGAGAIQPVAMTIIADLYPGEQRGKVQGYLASVWAISAVLGPIAGSAIVHSFSWAWIFWLNIPIGIAGAWLFLVFLREKRKPTVVEIDLLGAALFTTSVAALMIALTDMQSASLGTTVLSAVVVLVSLIGFLIVEQRVREPMISLALWRRRSIAAANCATLLASMALMGLTTFLPIYVQAVLGRSPAISGLALTMVLVGWPAAATLAARTYPRFGLRRLMIFGSFLVPSGAAFFALLGQNSSPFTAGIGSFVMGSGMGLISICSLILIQGAVEWRERGSATASNLFSRNLGSTLGAAILGAVMNYGLSRASTGSAIVDDRIARILNGTALLDTNNDILRNVLERSIHTTFTAVFLISLAIVIACIAVKRDVPSGSGRVELNEH